MEGDTSEEEAPAGVQALSDDALLAVLQLLEPQER